MIQVMLFIKNDDPQIERIQSDLSEIQQDFPHQLHIIDINQDQVLLEEYENREPVLDIGVYRLIRSFDSSEIRFAFEKAAARLKEAQKKRNDVLVRRITEPLLMTKSDRFSRWFSKHYMVLLNLFTFLYVFLAVLAPTFMHVGWETPAKIIYKVYRPLCHQLAFRTFFLFGEQIYYPRKLAGLEDVISYGEATGFDEYDINTAREFLGNDRLGYKMALCERDIAIYGAILLFGMAFSMTGKKIKPLPWYLWIIIGLGPIGLDGFSQLLSQTGLSIFNWLPLRESTPFLRTITGALFGMATAWFGYPYLEESVLENRREMQLKHAIVKQISS
ncbi:MAG: DUF2085 domain-containing protein [Chloroflexota bacterium]|nr:DUF2085 domain-containing protein [Chloroflexota bacterium]